MRYTSLNRYVNCSDDELLLELQGGNEKAFAEIYDRHHKVLYALAYRYLKAIIDAEDAVQYTFMRLWEQRTTLQIELSLRSYLFTVLKNHILNMIRHQTTVLEKQYEIAQKQEDFEDLEEKLENQDFQYHFRELISQLPEQKRTVCLLKIDKGLTNQEIADQMHISVPTVKSHYTQAIKMLREDLKKLLLLILLFLIE